MFARNLRMLCCPTFRLELNHCKNKTIDIYCQAQCHTAFFFFFCYFTVVVLKSYLWNVLYNIFCYVISPTQLGAVFTPFEKL